MKATTKLDKISMPPWELGFDTDAPNPADRYLTFKKADNSLTYIKIGREEAQDMLRVLTLYLEVTPKGTR